MKKIVLCLFTFFTAQIISAQEKNPILWNTNYKSISATEGEIIISATIEKGWHTYSQRPNDAIPVPTSFSFAPNGGYQLIGKTEESNAHEEFDKAFDAKIFVFADKAEFIQKIKLKAKPGFEIKIKVECISCNDMMCLPPKITELSVKVQ